MCSYSSFIPSAISMLWSLATKSSRKAGFWKPGSYNFHENRSLGRGSARSHLLAARKAVDTIRESTQVKSIISTPSTHVVNWPHAPRGVFASAGPERWIGVAAAILPFDSFFCFTSAVWIFPVIASCHVSAAEPQTCCLPHVLRRL